MDLVFDLCVVGGGSGGCGAAIAAMRQGLKVILVEKSDSLGGNAARGGVNIWAPGVGGTGIPFDTYKELKRMPNAVGICSFGRHCCNEGEANRHFPGGEHLIDPSKRYIDTLRRYGIGGWAGNDMLVREFCHALSFEPMSYEHVLRRMLVDAEICMDSGFDEVDCQAGRLRSIKLDNGRTVRARYWVDGTDGLLCVACGADFLLGIDAKTVFTEPHAPEEPKRMLNGATLIYRVSQRQQLAIDPLPTDVPKHCWWQERFPLAEITQYPNGDLNINMLPTLAGIDAYDMGHVRAYTECNRRVLAHWHDLQTRLKEFRRYRLSWIAPELGVRETRRIVCEYMLTEHDLLAGIHAQRHPDIITIADHAMDRHGEDGGCLELEQPYGVPFRCLVPKGFKNLLIAGRAAGFSSTAATSCRLSRTMMQLGQAAGTAAAVAGELGCDLPDIPFDHFRACLGNQHVQLEHPMPDDLKTYIRDEQDDLDDTYV